MILEEHYKSPKALLSPELFHKQKRGFPETVVTFFSKKLIKLFLQQHNAEEILELENETMFFPVYKTKYKNRNLIVFQSPVGAPASASLMEDIIALGAKNILAVGCCGCLDENLKSSDLIVPTSAIRDEGLSYHYLKPKDEIELNPKMTSLVCESLKKQKQNFITGKTWTNDGLYRETAEKASKRKKQGAIVVEMETSALAAVAEFRGVNFAQILYGADSLANGQYDKRTFRGDKLPKHTEGMVEIALNCAVFLDRELKKDKKNQNEIPQQKPKTRRKLLVQRVYEHLKKIKEEKRSK